MIRPRTADDLRELLGAELVPEGHFIEYKREVKPGRSENRELAKDMASFTVDGGQLVIGVAEDKSARHFDPHPLPLLGLAERISQIATSIVDPPLQVRCHELTDGMAGVGFLIVEVAASPQAPHQVDGRFWGRNDTTKYALGHAEVVRILTGRLERARQLDQLLHQELQRDPVPQDERANAHLHVIAAPSLARSSMLEDALTHPEHGWRWFLQDKIRGGRTGRDLGQQWAPDLNIASSMSRRADGWAFHSYCMGEDRRLIPNGEKPWNENQLLDLEIDESGTVHLFCGRASDRMRETPFLIEVVVAGLTSRAVRAAQTIADTSGYLGPWYIAVGVTGLLGLTSLTRSQRLMNLPVAYSHDRYTSGAEFTAAEIADDLSVVDRLLGRLWRGVGSDFTASELAT